MKVRLQRRWIALAAAAFIGFALWRFAPAGGGHDPTGASDEAVPVKIAVATRGRVDLSVVRVGTVMPLNTVVLRPRIDGQIQNVRFREGQMVSSGEVLIELDPLPFRAQLRAAEAQRAKDAALLENARRDLDRYENLLKLDSTTAQTRDTASATVQQLAAAVANDEAQLDLAKLALTYTTIRAPFSGRIGARLVDAGNLVHTTDSNGLAVLTQIQPISVSFALPQGLLAQLRDAQRRGPVPVLASLQESKEPLDRGELSLIDNQIDAATGTVRCKATFPNKEDTLWPGQFVNAIVRLRTLPDAVTVPSAAVQSGPSGAFVYVVSKDGMATSRPVGIIGVQGERSIIGSGLEGDEKVVVEGHFRLETNTRVRIESS